MSNDESNPGPSMPAFLAACPNCGRKLTDLDQVYVEEDVEHWAVGIFHIRCSICGPQRVKLTRYPAASHDVREKRRKASEERNKLIISHGGAVIEDDWMEVWDAVNDAVHKIDDALPPETDFSSAEVSVKITAEMPHWDGDLDDE